MKSPQPFSREMKCSSESTLCTMTESIRTVLTPLLIISYASGLKIIEFPKGHSRIWVSFLYMLLFWAIYYFLIKYTRTIYSINNYYSTEYFMCFPLDILATLLIIVFGVYHDKKFRNCLRKLDIIDNTLLNIGIMTDYHKLHKKTMYVVLGWLLMVILMSYATAHQMKDELNNKTYVVMYATIIRNYCYYINFIEDLIIASILGYIELKFDQINQYLLDLTRDNKCGTKLWKISMYQHRTSQLSNKEWIIWTVIHLHSELRKISSEIDSIFGAQMTVKMGCNFCYLALDLREIFSTTLINNFIPSNKILYIVVMLIWICINTSKIVFLNYVCETVSNKANATGNFMKKIPYSVRDDEIRENISLFLLQITKAPVRFYGIGLFQFGYKFLYGFSSSIMTVVVLLIQALIKQQT